MFSLIQRSYKDLPIRLADFGILHRNELLGTLSGLTRVRKFQQDDAHIFCRNDQIEEEILAVLDLLDYIYSVFNFQYLIELSTRPDQYLG
jgi:threonyl-tRNA synthetase